MKNILAILNLFLLFSCAHKSIDRSLKSPSLDGLRHESLNRYTNQDLAGLKGANKTIALCHSERYNEAFEQFKSDLDKNLNNPVYWNHLGTCYYLKGEYPKALIYLEISMKTAKSKKIKAAVFNNIGLVHLKQGNMAEAKLSFQTSIQENKRPLTPQYNLAQLYLSQTNYKRAEEILLKLASKRPKDVDFNYSLGHLYLMKKQFGKALSYLEKVPEAYRTREDVSINLATTYHLMGQHKKALKTLEATPDVSSQFAFQQTELKRQIEDQLKE
tara:strand:- start:260733 stop:261548 length:816 start_codon:yes stop_codon:yes gene_type:complete